MFPCVVSTSEFQGGSAEGEVLEMVLYSFDKELYETDLKQTAYEEGEQNKLINQVQKKLAKGKTVDQKDYYRITVMPM